MDGLSRMENMKKKHRRSSAVQWSISVIAVLCLIAFVLLVWFAPISIADNSMAATLEQGDIVFYNRLAKHVRLIERSDIVVFKDAQGSLIQRRVIANSGDTVEIREGVVYINEKYRVDEREYATIVPFNMSQRKVPEDCVFVLADNRQYQAENNSPSACMIKLDDILGIVQFNLNEFCFYK